MSDFPFSQLITQLNNAKISVTNNALYQTIKGLIDGTRGNQDKIIILESGAGGQSNINNKTQFLLAEPAPSSLPLSRELLAGTNVAFDDTVTNERTVNVTVPTIEVPIHWATLIVNNANFLTLPSTYLEIIPAPGVGKTIVPQWAYFNIRTPGGVYTNITPNNGLSITYGDWLGECFNWSLGWTGTSLVNMLVPIHLVPDATILFSQYPDRTNVFFADNLPLKFTAWNDGGDFTGGDAANSAIIGVAYSILDYNTGVFS